jgi:hypothetical protein
MSYIADVIIDDGPPNGDSKSRAYSLTLFGGCTPDGAVAK